MKVGESCFECIKGLAKRTLELIGLKSEFKELEELIRKKWGSDLSPPYVANAVLKEIRERFKVEDPFRSVKDLELKRAKKAFEMLKDRFPPDLSGALKLSAIGNSSDFFMNGNFTYSDMSFFGNLEEIEEGILNSVNVLIIGDNVADFVFDLKLIEYLKSLGKEVFYTVKGEPVQNDLSIKDVERYGLYAFFTNFISTGTAEVGLTRKDLKGILKQLWEGETFVIAKGMGNYETITEFGGRPVTYVMKVKCKEVGASTGYPVGSYLALYMEG